MKGLASLAAGQPGGRPLSMCFVGMVGADTAGADYRTMLQRHGVAPMLLESGSGAATATCLCLVTPDGQRTMRTALCAALELDSPTLLPPHLGGSTAPGDGSSGGGSSGSGMALLHCEGYCLYRQPVAAAAMRAAKAAGASVCIDLASFEVVQNCWAALDSLLQVRAAGGLRCWLARALQGVLEAAASLLQQCLPAGGCSQPTAAVSARWAADCQLLPQLDCRCTLQTEPSQTCNPLPAGAAGRHSVL